MAGAAVACDHVLHGVGRSVFLLSPLIILSVLVLGLGYVRLRHGPISLTFMVAPIERGINAELNGNSVRIDDALVSLSETGGLEFRLSNLRMREPDGDVVASAPLAAVELSTAALWSARIVPARIELIEPRLLLYYSGDGGLTMTFSKPVEPPAETDAPPPEIAVPAPVPATRPAKQAQPVDVPSGPLKRIDLARVVTDMSARARQRLDASSYLREFGLRNATVVLNYAGKSTEWRVPSLGVALMHGRARSVISGRATIASGGRSWQLGFETDESESARTLTLKTSVHALVPSSIAGVLPQLSLLQALDLPVNGDAKLELTSDGDIRSATLALSVGHGSLRLPALPEAPLEVDGGSINVAYDGVAQRVVLSPSMLSWRGSRMTISGDLEREAGETAHPAWTYQLRAIDGVFAAEEFKVPPVALQEWHAKGRILPHRGEIELAEFVLRAGGAEIALAGDLVTGAQPASTRLEGSISPMPLATLKALWPKAIAPGAREWVGERVKHASILGGKFHFLSGSHVDSPDPAAGAREHQLSMNLEASDVEMQVIDDMPPVAAPRALTRIENDGLEVNIPEAAIVLAPDRRVPLQGGRFTAVDIMSDAPAGEIVFTSQAGLGLVLETLERSPLTVLEEAGLPRQGIEGKVDAKIKVGLPLLADVQMSAIKVEAKARITDGRAKGVLGSYEVQGASLDLDVTEKAADANGEMLVNGVLAKLSWQRIFDAPQEKQPPLRITANLDNTDRNQLGLDINHIVQGEVPIELTITPGTGAQPSVRLHADLTNADLLLENVSWRKPRGRSASLQCDIARGPHRIELQNFKVAGDDIAIEGWAAIGPDNRLREFYFPDFSLNVVTRMEVQGTLRPDNVWQVKAHGPTFDGRDFFRSLFSLGQLAEQQPKPKNPRQGIDLEAEIGTVIGFSEVALRGLKLKLAKRGERLTALDARGTLDGGKPLAVVLRQEPGQPRKLLADSTDAGQAFKLTDFYPNIQGGRVRLEVNLDGKGAAEKTGILWVEEFRILGDPVVSEVFGGADDGRPAIDGERGSKNRRVVREVFEFDRMRVPFSVGYGQFVMEESYLRGPMLGASLRGKVDFKTRHVNLGGTYVPLQGLNSALCEIPLFGLIITGPKCEGVTGMTFAIQGPMEKPQVIVNPLSMLAPGIFRDIFQMTPFDPQVQRRDEGPNENGDGSAAAAGTSIGSPAIPAEQTETPGTMIGADTVDGWSSQTVAPKKKK